MFGSDKQVSDEAGQRTRNLESPKQKHFERVRYAHNWSDLDCSNQSKVPCRSTHQLNARRMRSSPRYTLCFFPTERFLHESRPRCCVRRVCFARVSF